MNAGDVELPGEEESCPFCNKPVETGDHAECWDVLGEMRRFINLPRQHASYFNWHDRQQKEKDIVQYFLEHQGEAHFFTEFEMTPEGEDPPDAWVCASEGERTALEITELVNQSAIHAQVRCSTTYSKEREKWSNSQYFQDKVNRCVTEKDEKCKKLFADGHTVHLLLHSDEMYVDAFYSQHLASGFKLIGTRFQSVWLLLSYTPGKGKPLVRLTESVDRRT